MRRIFEVLRRVTARRSAREIRVLVFEDLHWFDPQSAAFLERLIENFPGSRTLVVTNFRPEFSSAWMRHSYYQQLSLVPLSAGAVGEMINDLLGNDASLAPLPGYLVERTGGNPFFVEEVVRALVEDGTLVGRPGAYRLTQPLEQVGLPASVQAVLAARIDRLSAEHKPVLQSAAVIGRTFPEAVLARVTGQDAEALAEAVNALCAAELLQEVQRYPVAEYRFWHPLTQEVAYGTMLAGRRARLHAAVAEALIEHEADHLDEVAAVVAWHWEKAEQPLEAAEWNLRAGEFAMRSDLDEALRRWCSVIELLEGVEDSTGVVRTGVLARIRLLQYGARAGLDRDAAGDLETSGTRLVARLGDAGLRNMMLRVSATARFFAGDLEGCRDRYVSAARDAEDSDDEGLKAVAFFTASVAFVYTGPLSEGLAWSDRMLGICGEDPGLGVTLLGYGALGYGLCFRAQLLARMGRLAEAATALERALNVTRPGAEPEIMCWALGLRPHIAWLSGESDGARASAAEAVRIGEETGNVGALVIGLQGLAVADLIAGRPLVGIRDCERGLAEARKHGSGLFAEASLLAHLGLAQLAAGNRAEAARAADEAVAVAGRRGARVDECFALYVRAKGGVAQGLAATAIRADLDAALELAGEVGALTYEPSIHEELGRLHADESELGEAVRLYTAVGATGHARRLATELAGSVPPASAAPGKQALLE
jgi:adenylate cyclase